jgi:predicted membrane protein
LPEKLKAAQVSPLFKKDNSLDKSNYRPISVLPTISKFYERAIPSYPVAFLMFNLFICLVTKSSFIGLKYNLSLFVLFVSILFILGWVLSILMFLSLYHNKFLKQKTDKNWETYRKQRNLVTKLKKTSIKTYFFERTAGGPKSSTFTE